MMARPTIGLTFFLREKESIWNNGAAQNCVFLLRLLRASGKVGRVFAINGGEAGAPDKALMLSGLDIQFVRLEDVVDELDVLIEAAAQVSAEHVARVRSRGGLAVAFKFGNAFVIDAERMIHGKPSGGIFNGAQFDAVWTNPQHMRTCASFWETVHRAPVRCLPHIWEPLFVDAAVREFGPEIRWGYAPPAEHARRVGVFEPNINVVKTSVLPMVVCERAFRRRPDLLDLVYVTNALHLKNHLTFQRFAGALDVVRARHPAGGSRVSFEGRFNTPWFLAKYCDVMLAHQWENGLNYAYYDALHGGYPLVHNSDLLPEGVGYRYDGFDGDGGADALIRAMESHGPEQAERDKTFLATVLASCPANITAYERAMDEIVARKAA